MSLNHIQDMHFLMKQEQYRDMIRDVRRARLADEAQPSPGWPAGWQTVARVVAGVVLAGLLLSVASNAHAAAPAGASAAAATARRPAAVVASHAAEPIVDRGLAPVAKQLTAYEQRMLVKESRLDPSAAPTRSHPKPAARRAPGPTARAKYLALKLSQIE